jgi:quercetin dioxygenase-like cupin family protein
MEAINNAGGSGSAAVPGATEAGMAEVQRLVSAGQLRIEPLMSADLHEGQVLTWLRVELAPGVAEPAHLHPGSEGIFGIAGRGFVQLDRTDRVPLAPGTFVRVEPGTVKSLCNNGTEPLVVLALLVLDREQPPLTVVP